MTVRVEMSFEQRDRKTSKMVIKEMTDIFNLLDLDGNGDLDREEFKLGLRTLQVNITHADAMDLFDSIDNEGLHAKSTNQTNYNFPKIQKCTYCGLA